jgi:hypothetical protein
MLTPGQIKERYHLEIERAGYAHLAPVGLFVLGFLCGGMGQPDLGCEFVLGGIILAPLLFVWEALYNGHCPNCHRLVLNARATCYGNVGAVRWPAVCPYCGAELE